jgi:phosphoribosylglycinamide formyltransferase 1
MTQMSMKKMRIAILISGGGTTMLEIIRACKEGRLPYVEVACVVASADNAGGISKALIEGLTLSQVPVCSPRHYSDPLEFGDVLLRIFERHRVDFVSQNGWLPLTPSNVVAAYKNRMGNQHPGPIRPGRPDFGGKGMYGRRVHSARLQFVQFTKRNSWTEATYQDVDEQFDLGAVRARCRVAIYPDDNVETLQRRALAIEHQVVIKALHERSIGRQRDMTLDDDLVLPGEEELLARVKESAARIWPKG